jgi:hypothetical protein
MTRHVALILLLGAGCGAFVHDEVSPPDAAPTPPADAAALDAPSSLAHQYSFAGNLDDDLGGPALESLGGTFDAGGYRFTAGQGLRLVGVLPQTIYSIELEVVLDRVDGYNKVIDFKQLGTDAGLYVENGKLQFVVHPVMDCPNVGDCWTSPTQVFTAGTPTTIVLTRDPAGAIRASVGDQPQFVFPDSEASGTFDGANAVGHVMVDDTITNGSEASGGVVRRVRIYTAPI